MKPLLSIALLIGAGAFLLREQIAEAINGDVDQVLPPVDQPAPPTGSATPRPPTAAECAMDPDACWQPGQPQPQPVPPIAYRPDATVGPQYQVDYGPGRTPPTEMVGPRFSAPPADASVPIDTIYHGQTIQQLWRQMLTGALQAAGMPVNSNLTADQWNYYTNAVTGKAMPEMHNPANRGELLTMNAYIQRIEQYGQGQNLSGVRHRLAPMSGLRSWR